MKSIVCAHQEQRRVSTAPVQRSLGNGVRAVLALILLSCAAGGFSQVITIDRNGNATADNKPSPAYVDRRFAQIQPTSVTLSKTRLDARGRQALIRALQSEQGFAMRPMPRGRKGLTLVANGKLDPAGEGYLSMVTAKGICAQPGDRVVITDVKVDGSRIIFQLNGGPDRKHRFLRHVEIGAGPMLNPVVQTDDPDPTGARLTLVFPNYIPDLTGKDVQALLAPLISFGVKTPLQAYTDTLPPRLKAAILEHNVLVGMSTDMVLFAKGRPERKVREMVGQMPIEVWIYGKPPEDVDFVKINGNRVIGLEIAKVGKPVEVFTNDEVEGLMRTDGTPLEATAAPRTIQLGDVQRDPNTQSAAAPPSLRNPGEKLPTDNQRVGVMKPVQFPKEKPADQPKDQSKDASKGQSGTTAPATQQPATQPATAPATAPVPAPAAPSDTPSAAASQPQ